MSRADDRKFNFWQKWLVYSSLIFAVFGLILAVPGENIFLAEYERMLAAALLGGSTAFSHETGVVLSFIRGPFGATIACSYIFLAYLAAFPFKRKEAWSRNAIVAAFGIWFIVDSGVCIYYGVFFQVYVINLISFFQKVLPIIFTWPYFTRKNYNHQNSFSDRVK